MLTLFVFMVVLLGLLLLLPSSSLYYSVGLASQFAREECASSTLSRGGEMLTLLPSAKCSNNTLLIICCEDVVSSLSLQITHSTSPTAPEGFADVVFSVGF